MFDDMLHFVISVGVVVILGLTVFLVYYCDFMPILQTIPILYYVYYEIFSRCDTICECKIYCFAGGV
jgi:hypothetical protein